MMRMFRAISQLLMLWAVGLTLYDLVCQWISHARIKVRTLQELLMDNGKSGFESTQKILQSLLSPETSRHLLNLPAPVVIIAVAVLFYLIYRIMFMMAGESKSARL